MNLLILIPSDEYRRNAGWRIRYERITASLLNCGVRLDYAPLADFDPTTAHCDAVIISKCYDARALLAAAILTRRGVIVGLDLFDDYFSQYDDARLNRFRGFLRQATRSSSFVLCSTPALAAVARAYSSRLSIHILGDPATIPESETLAPILDAKLADVRSSGLVRIGWFGMGDNPYFSAGLGDLASFADRLRVLTSSGLAVELTILTNQRSLTAERLRWIRAMGLATNIQHWSEADEARLLRECFACFLPVNGQRFSRAKSLNRATTALAAGCQLLSAGYPLYQALDQFIYRDPAILASDIVAEKLRLSSGNLPTFRARIEEIASPEQEAVRLSDFLHRLRPPAVPTGDCGSVFLLHGLATNGPAHSLVQAAGGLSVASPFCPAPLAYDLMFAKLSPSRQWAMLLSEAAVALLSDLWKPNLTSYGRVHNRPYWRIDLPLPEFGDGPTSSISLILVLYPAVLRWLIDLLPDLFGPGEVLISENSTLPLEIVA